MGDKTGKISLWPVEMGKFLCDRNVSQHSIPWSWLQNVDARQLQIEGV